MLVVMHVRLKSTSECGRRTQ